MTRNARMQRLTANARKLRVELLETRNMLATLNLIEQFPSLVPDSVAEMHEYFGRAVAIDGDRAIVGAPQSSDIDSGAGEAYVFERVEGQWKRQAILQVPDADRSAFGLSVAIDGDTIIVAAPGADEDDFSGAVYVFGGSGENWILRQTLVSSSARANDGFGSEVDIDGDTIVVASKSDFVFPAFDGHVEIYEKSDGFWERTFQTGENILSEPSGAATAVAVDGDQVAIGIPEARRDIHGNPLGTVVLFKRHNGAWAHASEISPPSLNYGAAFGAAVGLNAGTLVVSAPWDNLDGAFEYSGAAYVYQHDDEGWDFVQRISVRNPADAMTFGETLALDGDTLAITNRMWRKSPTLQATYLFVRSDDGRWLEQTKTRAESVNMYFSFGLGVAVSGSTLVIGSPFDDTVGVADGIVLIYEVSTASSDVSLYAAKQVGMDLVRVEYGVQGINTPIQFSAYRSADTIFDAEDIEYAVSYSEIVATNGTGTHSFDPGSFDPSRPYIIVCASSTVEEHTLENNQIVVRLSAPSGIELRRTKPGLTSDGFDEDNGFADSIAIEGDWAVVGAPYDDRSGTDAGIAYVYQRVAGQWLTRGTISASDAQAGDQFGSSVAVSGNMIVIGAQYDGDTAPGAGAVYVFALVDGVWIEHTKLRGEATQDAFGNAVAIENGTIVVGAHWNGTSSSNLGGAVYVFELVNNAFSQVFRMTRIPDVPRGNYWLGESVAIDGNRIAVGAPEFRLNDGRTGGTVVMLERVNGIWEFQQFVVMPDGASGDRFGESVALEGETLLVGAPEKDNSNQIVEAGAVYIFDLDSGQWQLVQKLTSNMPTGGGFFGREVKIADDAIYVLGWQTNKYMGMVDVYRRKNDGGWLLEEHLTDTSLEGNRHFNASMAASDDDFLVSISMYEGGIRGREVGVYEIVRPEVAPLAGDYNLNGVVDAADYSVWRDSLGTSGLTPYSGADGDGDGTVDQDDYLVWKANFGRMLGAGSGGQGAGSEVSGASSLEQGVRILVAQNSVQQGSVEESTTGRASSGTHEQGAGSGGQGTSSETRAVRWRRGVELLGLDGSGGRTQTRPPAEPGAGGWGRVAVVERDLALLAWRSSWARWQGRGEGLAVGETTGRHSQDVGEADGVFEELGLGGLNLRTR